MLATRINDKKHAKGAARPVRQTGETLRVGAVARRLGVSATMLRSWEKLGFATPQRTQSKYRQYSTDDLRVLRRAIYLRRVQGLNAPAILSQMQQEGLLKHPASAAPQDESIGPRFRRLRLQRGKSLSTVASAVGVSNGFLSNLERSRTGASIRILRKLAHYYGLNVFDWSKQVHDAGPIVRPRDRQSLEAAPGVYMEPLASGKVTMEPSLFRVAPGAGNGDLHSHEGEEFLYLVRGRLNVTLGNEEFRLRSGDGFYFSSNTQHRWSNPGKTETIVLWVSTPPTF